MTTLDSLDKKLALILGQNAHQTSEKLARRLRCSPATIRRRLRRLIRSGSLHIVGLVDPAELGMPLGAVISLDVAHDKLQTVFAALEKQPEIKWLSTTTGRFDIMAIGRFASIEGLSEFMANDLAHIDGVNDSETSICLGVKNGHNPPLV